ncbi:NAC domain-containing protein [Quillaja saponaria]|uniref:NAC domain-containing protein n=1 Tax=Quillaja saponaria TaxID=32244 RepID=A0AAD7KT14_QUISA|nr:NAC domain-containing protein [Quillaja saponaria]KAJ7945249.1 NAC domain-containing protein [Quillaja saponaria]
MEKKLPIEVVKELDIYKYAPWDLPDKSCMSTGDLKWYFFCPTMKKYASGSRMNRATEIGYWKTTGRDRPILYIMKLPGNRKTLIFHTGKAPRGDRTDWVMHEYRLEDKNLADKGIAQDAYVLCMVFQKDGPGPRNGANYGVPFNEKDWDDDDEELNCVEPLPSAAAAANCVESFPSTVVNCLYAAVNSVKSCPSVAVSAPVSMLANNHDSSLANVPDAGCVGSSSVSCLSGAMPYPCNMIPSVPNNDVSYDAPQLPAEDDMIALLSCLADEDTMAFNDAMEKDDTGHGRDAEVAPSDVNDIFNGLGDLGNLAGLGENGYDCQSGHIAEYSMDHMFAGNDSSFLELSDLDVPLHLAIMKVGTQWGVPKKKDAKDHE